MIDAWETSDRIVPRRKHEITLCSRELPSPEGDGPRLPLPAQAGSPRRV